MRHEKKVQWRYTVFGGIIILLILAFSIQGGTNQAVIDLGLSANDYQAGKVPSGWTLKKRIGLNEGEANWIDDNGTTAVRLHSKAALTFLGKKVDIDIKKFHIVSWKWKVENILQGIDERTPAGDDHPIRIFFVFEPDRSKQSTWFRIKRFLYLDHAHGHPIGGRFTEYLWSSHLNAGDIINDPGKPWQKLMVIEGGAQKLGIWLDYRRNLYKDFKKLYGEEPRRLIFIAILNDTDQTGLEAVSYIADLKFQKHDQ